MVNNMRLQKITNLSRGFAMSKLSQIKTILLLTACLVILPCNLLAGYKVLQFSGMFSQKLPYLLPNLQDMLKADLSNIEDVHVVWEPSSKESYEGADCVLRILVLPYIEGYRNVTEDEIKLFLMIYDANTKLNLIRFNPNIKNDPVAMKKKGILCIKDFEGKKSEVFNIEKRMFNGILNTIKVAKKEKKIDPQTLFKKMDKGLVVIPPPPPSRMIKNSYKSRGIAYLLTDDLKKIKAKGG